MKKLLLALTMFLFINLALNTVNAGWQKDKDNEDSNSIPNDGSNDSLQWDWSKTSTGTSVSITTIDNDKSGTYTGGSASMSLWERYIWNGGGSPPPGTFTLTVVGNCSTTVTCKKHYQSDGSEGDADSLGSISASSGFFDAKDSTTCQKLSFGWQSAKKADLLTSSQESDPNKRKGLSISGDISLNLGTNPATWSGTAFHMSYNVESLDAAISGVEEASPQSINTTEQEVIDYPQSTCQAVISMSINPGAAGVDGGGLGYNHQTTVAANISCVTLDISIN